VLDAIANAVIIYTHTRTRQTDRYQTDGRTDGQTDGRTDR